MNGPNKCRGWDSDGEWGRAKTMLIRELNSQLVKIEEPGEVEKLSLDQDDLLDFVC